MGRRSLSGRAEGLCPFPGAGRGGNAVAFTLDALVATIQALRLELYELFSRVFEVEGRPFQPWYLPVRPGPNTRPG